MDTQYFVGKGCTCEGTLNRCDSIICGCRCHQIKDYIAGASWRGALVSKHGDQCANADGEWSGTPNPLNPADEWICDECDEIVSAKA